MGGYSLLATLALAGCDKGDNKVDMTEYREKLQAAMEVLARLYEITGENRGLVEIRPDSVSGFKTFDEFRQAWRPVSDDAISLFGEVREILLDLRANYGLKLPVNIKDFDPFKYSVKYDFAKKEVDCVRYKGTRVALDKIGEVLFEESKRGE